MHGVDVNFEIDELQNLEFEVDVYPLSRQKRCDPFLSDRMNLNFHHDANHPISFYNGDTKSLEEMSQVSLCYEYAPRLQAELEANEAFTQDFSVEELSTANGMNLDYNQHNFLVVKSKTNQKRYLIDPSYKQFVDQPEGQEHCLILELTDFPGLKRDLDQVGAKRLDAAELQRYLFPQAKDYPEKDLLRKLILFSEGQTVDQDYLNKIDESFVHLVNSLEEQLDGKSKTDIRQFAFFFYLEKALMKLNPRPSRLVGSQVETVPLKNADAVVRVQIALSSAKARELDSQDLDGALKEFSLDDSERKIAAEALRVSRDKFTNADKFHAMYASTPLSLLF